MANKNINDLPTATSLNAGDKLEILQGGTNKQIDASLLGAVQSVTGTQVDNTDPNNPIVNPLGLIKIIDKQGDFFTDLATASAYVATFNVAGIISDESYYPIGSGGVYYFTVPQGSDFSGADSFLSDPAFINTTSVYIEDRLGLIIKFNDYALALSTGNSVLKDCTFRDYAFYNATGDNTLGDNCTFNVNAFSNATGDNTVGDNCTFDVNAFVVTTGDNTVGDNCTFNVNAFSNATGDNTVGDNCTFGDSAFSNATGDNTVGDNCTFGDYAFNSSSGIYTLGNFTLSNTANYFATNSTGTFKLNGTIGASTAAEYSNFFSTSLATIFARKAAYTNNAGGIEGDLQTAISNGCNVQFDGINLATLNTNQTLTNKTFDSPTITVGGITVSSTELSYLDSATSNIQTQLNSKTKIVGFDTADALTPANTSNNVIKSITIPANTYTDGNVLRLFGGGDKTGIAGTTTVRIYANTVNNLTGTPILMAQSVFSNTALTFQIDRNLFVRSTTTWGYASNVNNSMGFIASSTINSNDLAIDWTVTQYIIIAIQLANGADQVNVKVFAVVNF